MFVIRLLRKDDERTIDVWRTYNDQTAIVWRSDYERMTKMSQNVEKIGKSPKNTPPRMTVIKHTSYGTSARGRYKKNTRSGMTQNHILVIRFKHIRYDTESSMTKNHIRYDAEGSDVPYVCKCQTCVLCNCHTFYILSSYLRHYVIRRSSYVCNFRTFNIRLFRQNILCL